MFDLIQMLTGNQPNLKPLAIIDEHTEISFILKRIDNDFARYKKEVDELSKTFEDNKNKHWKDIENILNDKGILKGEKEPELMAQEGVIYVSRKDN